MAKTQTDSALSADARMTEYEKQSHELLQEVVAKIEQVGTKLTDLDDKTRSDLANQAKELSKLDDNIRTVQADYAKRFMAIAEHHGRQGRYRGHFADAEQARTTGRLIALAITRDQAIAAELQQAGITPIVGGEGGYLMPEVLLDELVRNVEEAGVWERNVEMMPAPLSAGIPVGTGGVTLYYPDYAGAATLSAPTFGRKNFQCQRHTAYVAIDRWMLKSELAIALAEYVMEEMSYALSLGEDTNWFAGDGTAAYAGYTGLLNDTDLASYTPTTDYDEFSELIAVSSEPLSRMLGTLPTWSVRGQCKWYMHSSIFFGYLGIQDTAGMPIVQIYLGAGGPEQRLMGYPVEWVQVMPALGGALDGASKPMLLAGDLRRCCKGFRFGGGIEFRTSEHVRFAEGEIVMLVDVPQDRVVKDPTGICRLITHS